MAPSAAVEGDLTYQVTHGQGYTRISHRRANLEVSATWCVDAQTSVKQVHLVLVNHGQKTQHLRLIGMVELLMVNVAQPQ